MKNSEINLLGSFKNRFDIVFLVFLILILHVSLIVKLVGVLWIIGFHRRFAFNRHMPAIPPFYVLMTILCAVLVLININRGMQYLLLGGLAISYWLVLVLLSKQMMYRVHKSEFVKIENTLALFFILNALVSGVQFLSIVLEIRAINPFVYDGLHFKYSTSTGDYIKGITMDISTTNMVINALGLFYFLFRRRFVISTLCFLIVLFTTSNLGNFIITGVLLWVLCFNSQKLFKGIALCYIAVLITFIIKISPTNLNYLNTSFKSIFGFKKDVITRTYHDETEKDQRISEYLKIKYGIKNSPNKKQKIIRHIVTHQNTKQLLESSLDSLYSKKEDEKVKQFKTWYKHIYKDTSYKTWNPVIKPAKLNAIFETCKFCLDDPMHLICGAGPGCFSSKLAFKASGIQIAGSYPERFVYIAPEFKTYHLKSALAVLTKPIGDHSVINFPNSVYNQLLGEYGILGVLLFIIFYVGYFIKRWRLYRSGKILLPMCLLFLATDYWFEAFSMVIVFELMMYLEAARSQNTVSHE
jgi:hypothetical protein